MNLTAIATVATILTAGASLTFACIKVGLVAGRWDGRISSLTKGMAELTESLQAFAERADERLNTHGEQLARHDERLDAHARELSRLRRSEA